MSAHLQDLPTYAFYLLTGAVFIALWCLNCLFTSWQSGWRLLSGRFRIESEFMAEIRQKGRYPFELCFRKWFDYTNIVWVAPEEDALYLSVIFPFRIGHPPLCIPWTEISVGRTKFFWRKYIVLSLGSQERVPMRIAERMARELGIPRASQRYDTSAGQQMSSEKQS